MQYLDFEKPIADLEKKIEELENLSTVGDGILKKEIASLNKRLKNLGNQFLLILQDGKEFS